MTSHTHWRNLNAEHWTALKRCCSSTSGRAQVDIEVAQPLLDLGWIRESGYGYAPTRPGHDALEAGPPLSTASEVAPGARWQEQGRPAYEQPAVVVADDRSPLSPCYTEQRPSSLPWIGMLAEDALRWAWPFLGLAGALWLLLR